MVISNPQTFGKMKSTNARGQKSVFTQMEATAVFNRRLARVENNLIDKLDRELMLRRIVRERLEAKGLVMA